ncbi:MAG TPA: response regulator transcription factor [Gemmatimonadales bacterium]|jgi:DNA-binding NarL/FixJ family response regulator|nr:response regulator transcription factor [Gemmatimonadales bacterium]
MIRVVIADDHPLVRAGLRQVLSDEPAIEVVGEAADGDETVAVLRATEPDVVLLDITMPGAPFPGLLRLLRSAFPRIEVLIVTMHGEDQFAVRALKEGAAGYLTKQQPPEEVISAIKQIAGGGRYLTAAVAERAAAALDGNAPRLPHERVSRREYEVLCMIGLGKSVKQIATELGVSPKTVSTHRARLLRKMHLKTSAELIRYVLQYGLTA